MASLKQRDIFTVVLLLWLVANAACIRRKPMAETETPRPVDQVETSSQNRATTDYLTALTSADEHCKAEREVDSKDPRCQTDTCQCFNDPTLPWNCELVLIKKDGKRESLGNQQKPDRDSLCNASLCRGIFADIVREKCPVLQ